MKALCSSGITSQKTRIYISNTSREYAYLSVARVHSTWFLLIIQTNQCNKQCFKSLCFLPQRYILLSPTDYLCFLKQAGVVITFGTCLVQIPAGLLALTGAFCILIYFTLWYFSITKTT
jgi:hypothetical protein